MRSVVSCAGAVLVALFGCAGARHETSSAESESREHASVSFLASAPQGLSMNDLGRPFNKNFQRLPGRDGATLFPLSPQAIVTPQNLMKHEVSIVEDAQLLYASASAWSLQGDIERVTENRYASYRAMFIQEVYEIDDSTEMRRVASDAVYYPARIYTGHSYESLFWGNADSFHTGLAASLLVAEGEIGSFAQRNKLKFKAIGRGLVPRFGNAIFSRDADDIEVNYEIKYNSAVPILVEWRTIPGRKIENMRFEWKKLKKGCNGKKGCEPCSRWSFSEIAYAPPESKANGNSWDADSSAPDVVISISAGMDLRTTAQVSNSWNPSWEFSTPILVNANDTIATSIIDVDVMENDYIDSPSIVVPEYLDKGTLVLGAGSLRFYGVCVE